MSNSNCFPILANECVERLAVSKLSNVVGCSNDSTHSCRIFRCKVPHNLVFQQIAAGPRCVFTSKIFELFLFLLFDKLFRFRSLYIEFILYSTTWAFIVLR
jgi:hypothetical protein